MLSRSNEPALLSEPIIEIYSPLTSSTRPVVRKRQRQKGARPLKLKIAGRSFGLLPLVLRNRGQGTCDLPSDVTLVQGRTDITKAKHRQTRVPHAIKQCSLERLQN